MKKPLRVGIMGLVLLAAVGLTRVQSATWANQGSAGTGVGASRLIEKQVETDLVPAGSLDYAVLLPEDFDPQESYPLIIGLHGGGGSHQRLASWAPLIDDAVRAGTIPPSVWSTPSAGRSFYLDYRDGSEQWETALLDFYLPALEQEFGHRARRDVVVFGVSMGGMGGLRLAFKHPDRFGAVAVLEPAIEAAVEWGEVQLIDKFYRADQYEEKFGNPEVDAVYWAENHPTAIAASNPRALDELNIYFDVGDEDSLKLYRGAEYLHRILFDHGVRHEYRLVRGADHIGAVFMDHRVRDALSFIGRHFKPLQENAATRATIDTMRQSQPEGLGQGLPLPPHN